MYIFVKFLLSAGNDLLVCCFCANVLSLHRSSFGLLIHSVAPPCIPGVNIVVLYRLYFFVSLGCILLPCLSQYCLLLGTVLLNCMLLRCASFHRANLFCKLFALIVYEVLLRCWCRMQLNLFMSYDNLFRWGFGHNHIISGGYSVLLHYFCSQSVRYSASELSVRIF